jgi:hypothetical protein
MRLVLENWLLEHEFTQVFEKCNENCVEVFWNAMEPGR